MKARLLILSFTYPPNQDGVANAAALMAEGLAARGCEVALGTLWHPERKPASATDNPKVFQFKVEGDLSWRATLRGETAELRQFVAGFNGDALICHCLDTALVRLAVQEFPRLPAAKLLVSHGYTRHLVPWHSRFPWGLGFWLGWQPFVWQLPWLLRKFDRLVFLSEQQDFGRFFDHRVAHLIRHPGIRVIPNGVDWRMKAAALPDFRRAYRLEGRVLFLCVANYGERKNQLLALQAYRQARVPNSALVFIGSEFNDYSRRVQQADQQLALAFPEGRVLLLEQLDRPWTEAAFAAMDCFVLTARAETQPIVLLETMAASKPFISTNTGCVQTLPGVVVRNQHDLTLQFQRLAADPELRARLGAEGNREYLKKYRKEMVVDAYERLVLELRKNPILGGGLEN
jgi:glycosyltransferase involved in cell wall biosynthesis